jgi:multidrug resistance efflux pump
VEKVLVDRGSLVHKGQLLVQLSAPEINSQTAASEASLHQAEADMAQAEAQAAAAESTSAKLQEAAKTQALSRATTYFKPKNRRMRRRHWLIAERPPYEVRKNVFSQVGRWSRISM